MSARPILLALALSGAPLLAHAGPAPAPPAQAPAPDAAVETALAALASSCDGLAERLLLVDCSASPCQVHVGGVDHRGAAPDWAALTCQDADRTTLFGAFVASYRTGGPETIEAGLYTVALGAPPPQEFQPARFQAAVAQVAATPR